MGTTAKLGVLVAVFAVGFFAGSVSQRDAEAQLGDALKAAGGAAADSAVGDATGSAGSLGQVAKLGTAITDMQANVDSLQKNLELLNTIKGALGG
jgi:hypothetical protein